MPKRGVAAIRPPLPSNSPPHDYPDRQRHWLNSAGDRPTLTTIGAAARTTESVTCAVGLVTEQVEVDEVETKATPAGAARATGTAVAAPPSAATSAEHRHHGTGRQQLHVLAIDLSNTQYSRHEILLGKGNPGDSRER
jgi:hypothetical protein